MPPPAKCRFMTYYKEGLTNAPCYVPSCTLLNVKTFGRLVFKCGGGNLSYAATNSVIIPPPNNEVVGGYIGFTPSVCPSFCPSVCPGCRVRSVTSTVLGWILSISATNDHYHERVCRTQWPLTLTYIFKVIRPWLRKSCPLCSVYSSGWILFIFGTNDHYH